MQTIKTSLILILVSVLASSCGKVSKTPAKVAAEESTSKADDNSLNSPNVDRLASAQPDDSMNAPISDATPQPNATVDAAVSEAVNVAAGQSGTVSEESNV